MSQETHHPLWRSWKFWASLSGIAGAVAVFVWLNGSMPRLALFWLFGIILGVVLQRSRFCFVSAVSNCFLFRDTRLLEGVLGGLFVATVGFTFIMFRSVPDPSTGTLPIGAILAPVGWHLVLGGVIFGFGMLLAGGCIIGNMFRIGEGGIPAIVAFLGIMLGMGALQFTWPWWWNNYISHLSSLWLPAEIGWFWAVALTLGVIIILLILVRRMRYRQAPQQCAGETIPRRIARTAKELLTKGWPLALGGVVLGAINIVLYLSLDRPWTVTGELMTWSQGLFTAIHLPPPAFTAVPGT
jgi:uncharacterized membrane protein YedE/YeeE